MIAVEVVANVLGFKAIARPAVYAKGWIKTNGRQINRNSWLKSRFGCRP